jgi:hypothetical protein
MSNPFHTGQFTCCSCPEGDGPPAKYLHRCGCPGVSIECESQERVATLCGWSEFSNSPSIVASVPPKKYLVFEARWTAWSQSNYCCDSGDAKISDAWSLVAGDGYVKRRVYDVELCLGPSDTVGSQEVQRVRTRGAGCVLLDPPETTYTPLAEVGINPDVDMVSTTLGRRVRSDSSVFGPQSACDGKTAWSFSHTYEEALSEEDTDEDALSRAVEVPGTLCSSIHQIRTTAFSFTLREAKYTLKFTNLQSGRNYVGCARLRRRKAFSGDTPEGESTDWEDVAPDTFGPFQRTSSNTEDGVTQPDETTDVDLPYAEGWEYQIVSAHVWPQGADCTCTNS